MHLANLVFVDVHVCARYSSLLTKPNDTYLLKVDLSNNLQISESILYIMYIFAASVCISLTILWNACLVWQWCGVSNIDF